MYVTPGLYAPQSYHDASKDLVKKICNGCGTKGWKGKIVPDTILFLRITETCDIHDWMYEHGLTKADKDFADDMFLQNMITLIQIAQEKNFVHRFLAPHRTIRAHEYYYAVVYAGNDAFWVNKGKTNEEVNSIIHDNPSVGLLNEQWEGAFGNSAGNSSFSQRIHSSMQNGCCSERDVR